MIEFYFQIHFRRKIICWNSHGCTGGKHRSVVMTEEIGKWLKNDGKDSVVIHRDMKES